MPFTNDIVLGGRMMILGVGVSGTGKTVGAASFPGDGLILDCDGRVEPIKKFYPNKRVEYFTVGLEGDTRPGVIDFMSALKKIENLQDNCPYDWISLDSYTMFSATCIMHQMGYHAEDVKRTKGGLPIPDWDEFKGETATMLKVMEILKILPCHVIVTAHPILAAKTTKQTGSVNDILASMVKGQSLATYGWKTPSFLPNYFNEMYFFFNEVSSQMGQTVSHKVQTVSAGEIVAKTALPLPAVMDITDKPLYAVIQAHLKTYNIKIQEKAAEKARLNPPIPVLDQGGTAQALGKDSTPF